jgi:hypothetical protein
MGHFEDICIHEEVVLEHVNRLFEIFKHTPDVRRQMNHTVERRVFLKQMTYLTNVPKVSIFRTDWNPIVTFDITKSVTNKT